MHCESIYPVILQVPEDLRRGLVGKEKVAFLRGHARQAVRQSADFSGCPVADLPMDQKRVPLPADGIYWSLSHKSGYVAGVVAPHPIGIDVESIRPVDERLIDRVLDASERQLAGAGADPAFMFFRFWTAKETILKLLGIGLAGLSNCRIQAVVDERHLIVDYQENRYMVAQTFFNHHVAAVLKTGGQMVRWRMAVS